MKVKGPSMTPGPSIAILVAAKPTRTETMASPIDDIVVRLEQLGPNQVRLMMSSGGFPTHWYVYPVHVTTRKSFGLMTRKLSVTESQRFAQFRGTFSRRKPSVASANWAQVA